MIALVTGAAGFLGSHLTDRLLNEGYEVIGIDNLISGSLDNLAHLKNNKRFRFSVGDVRKSMNFKVGMVFNFACPASPVCYQKYPIPTFNTSVMGAQNLIKLARKSKCKIIQASTSEVYGDPLVHPQAENYWGNVNPVGPRACYDEGKRAAETFLTDAKRTFNIDARIIRIFNTYGSRMKPDDGRVVSSFITQALNNNPITIHGHGKQSRSFCYVDDLIDGIMRIAIMDQPTGPINLGNPQEITIKDLAVKIIQLTNSQSEIVYQQRPEDDPQTRCPDITKAMKTVGFVPKVSLDDGLLQTIGYFKNILDK